MDFMVVGGILLVLLIYIIALIHYLNNRIKYREIEVLMEDSNGPLYEAPMKTFNYEDKILKKFKIKPDSVRLILYTERLIIFIALVVLLFLLKGLALAGIGAIIVTIIADDAYKKEIYNSGITNISRVTNFINYFVPHINSGNSADQSLLGYMEYSKDKELADFYENRDNPNYKIEPHLQQIIDVYDIAKYNEDQGISDYVYILNELSEDMSQKQTYYNSFISRIGEIKPIMWSYYFGVPILIVASFSQTRDFWMGFGGFIVGFVLLGLFSLFKFLIFKLQKNTIKAIF